MKSSLRRVASTAATVLLVGETGTGKSMLAGLIHKASSRARGPFVRLDCTCHGDALIDSLLFGHRRGAFTGAVDHQEGLITAAEGGTLFIDEISELPIGVQGRLLTLLEERTFRMVGTPTLKTADVRVIVATNKQLDEEVNAGRFRQDLLYRLGEVTVTLPPLREHLEDIPDLADVLLARLCMQHGRSRRLSGAARRALSAYPWPGNVRQLRKVIERAVVLGESTIIAPSDLGLGLDKTDGQAHNLMDVQRQHIARVLSLTGGNKSRAARLLGVKRSTLYSRLQALGLH
jgi:DNA-binding NtrC family response regulator